MRWSATAKFTGQIHHFRNEFVAPVCVFGQKDFLSTNFALMIAEAHPLCELRADQLDFKFGFGSNPRIKRRSVSGLLDQHQTWPTFARKPPEIVAQPFCVTEVTKLID